MKNSAKNQQRNIIILCALALTSVPSAFACGPTSQNEINLIRMVTDKAMGSGDDEVAPIKNDPRVRLDEKALASDNARLVRLAKMAPSVALISDAKTGEASGSGVLLKTRCHVLTVRHVVSDYMVADVGVTGNPGMSKLGYTQDLSVDPVGKEVGVALGFHDGVAEYKGMGKVIAVGIAQNFDYEFAVVRVDGVPKSISGMPIAPLRPEAFTGNRLSKEVSLTGFQGDMLKKDGRPEVYTHAGCVPTGPGEVEYYDRKTKQFTRDKQGVQTTCNGVGGVSGGPATVTGSFNDGDFDVVWGMAGGGGVSQAGMAYAGKVIETIIVPIYGSYASINKAVEKDLAEKPCQQ